MEPTTWAFLFGMVVAFAMSGAIIWLNIIWLNGKR